MQKGFDLKLLKIIGMACAFVIGLMIIALLDIAFWPVTTYQPPSRDRIDEQAYRLEEKVGWYLFNDGQNRLLTMGAENGLILCRFGFDRDQLEFKRFIPISPNTLVSKSSSGRIKLEFSDSTGGTNKAVRMIDNQDSVELIQKVTEGGYETQEVTYYNGSIRLSGLLFIPDGPGPHPAAAFIHGSGVSHRERFWYLSPADHLAKQGIMVLLPDKRGCGKSGGEWHIASFEDFAADAIAAVNFIYDQSAADQSRIGLVGFSQGGWIAPLAASQNEKIKFIVSVSGSAAKPAEQLEFEMSREIANSGAPQFIADIIAPLIARRAKLSKKKWWDLNGQFDPIPHWLAIDKRSLMIFGEEDQNVNVNRSLQLLKQAGLSEKENFKIKLYAGLTHSLIRTDSGWLEKDYLKSMARFINH